jgi:hypothetical protein
VECDWWPDPIDLSHSHSPTVDDRDERYGTTLWIDHDEQGQVFVLVQEGGPSEGYIIDHDEGKEEEAATAPSGERNHRKHHQHFGIGRRFILSIDVNQTDASPIDVDAQVDALLARRRKQKAPIQTIDVRSSKQVSYHGTTAVGSDHNDGGEHQLHRHLQKVLVVVVDTDDDIAEHEHDEEEMSVLTMDPTLLAISRREAEGHVLAPHRVARPPHYMPPCMRMEPQEYMVVDVDDHDAASDEDLSEIAPLDLVSL